MTVTMPTEGTVCKPNAKTKWVTWP